MSETKLNSLERSASAYLRSAMHQPVDWQEWGEAAFARAATEDKPVLLDIGAVWCHWCHVMDRESYENADTARVINENFIAVKVDRDERPDVDTRYQAAVASISGQGGWPLTAFLTPDGRPYFGGTYFPPEDRYGRPSFQRVLLTMASAYEDKREQVLESAASVMQAIEHNESFAGGAANPGPEIVEKLAKSAIGQFDARFGGFGSQPKFPHCSAIDLLIDMAARGIEPAQNAARVTLEKMAAGGIYDQLAGGFHRYSVDERWVVPHFEKMAYDNSELLKNYVHAFQTFVDPECARIARETMRWMEEWLSDRERGGFYASQDADDSLDDDGDYFTWTLAEASSVLDGDELKAAVSYYDIGDVGDMHHNPAKNVLHVSQGLSVAARAAGVGEERARQLVASAKQKLYAARLKRKTPYVDKTLYAGWNGMCISAFVEAGRVLGRAEAVEFGTKSLDRLLASAWDVEHGLGHVIAYGEAGGTGARVAGVLDDYAFAGQACLDVWEATGEIRYYRMAVQIADAMLRRFYDAEGGGFFDTESNPSAIGVLAARRKPVQDAPTPAGNPVAAALLLRLADLSGNETYAERAQKTLETFAGIVEHFGLFVATYGLALQRMVTAPVQVCVIGDDARARELEKAALARYAVNKSVIRLRTLGELPPALAETLPHLPAASGSFAVVCSGRGCQPPVEDADKLAEMVNAALAH